ncbi:MAG: (Fe-S)-binding protein [Pirellulales bacterium]
MTDNRQTDAAGSNASPVGRGEPACKNNPGAGIRYGFFLDCVHCGLCTTACPTFTELGNENESPRGRIYLMRAVTDGRLELSHEVHRHLDLCLDCRACETACPSGVQYGRLIEPFRLAMAEVEDKKDLRKRFDWFRNLVLFQLFPYAGRMRPLLAPVRLAQRMGLYGLAERMGLFNLVPGRMGRMITLLPEPKRSGPKLPEFLPAIGPRRARVAFFVGCVADAMFRHTHWATIRVLQQNGCEIVVPRGQACCGAIHHHSGSSEGARKLADRNLAAFNLDDVDAIIVNHGGCGAMLKEYGHHWEDDRQEARRRFSAKVKDINEFLDELGLIPPTGEINAVATYHDACHLGHAQKVREQPRRLLAQIPGLVLKELPETEICCGSAGTYNLNEPGMAERLNRRKLANILSTGARIVLASNAGCLLQIGREIRQQGHPLVILHPMDLLDMSYRGEQLQDRGATPVV